MNLSEWPAQPWGLSHAALSSLANGAGADVSKDGTKAILTDMPPLWHGRPHLRFISNNSHPGYPFDLLMLFFFL